MRLALVNPFARDQVNVRETSKVILMIGQTKETPGLEWGRRLASLSLQANERIWIYVPTKVSEDSSFPFKIGDPCLIQLDIEEKRLLVKTIGKEEAVKLGW